MLTITLKWSDKRTRKLKFSERAILSKQRAEIFERMTRTGRSYTTEQANETLGKDLTTAADVLELLKAYRTVGEQAIETLFDLNDDHHNALLSVLRRADFPSASHQKVYVPTVLEQFSEVYSNDRGVAVGKGEILACMLFKHVYGIPNARYDINVGGTPWHVKDHRQCVSTPLGKPSVEDENNPSWRDNETLIFLRKLGAGFNFGTDFFIDAAKKDREIEKQLMKEYNTDDLLTAALALEFDLDFVMRDSTLMGDAPGILFLKKDENGLYFERIDTDHLHFYAISNDNIKVSDQKGRFVSAIMAASVNDENIRIKKLLKEEKVFAKRVELDARRIERKRLEAELAKKEKEERASKSHAESLNFKDLWNNSSDISILEQAFGMKPESIRAKKKRIEIKFPEFYFKKLVSKKRIKG